MKRLRLFVVELCLLGLCVLGLIGLFSLIAESEQPAFARPKPRHLYDLYPIDLSLLNLSGFGYIINNDICGRENIKIIFLVTSHCINVEARSAMRQAYPKAALLKLGIERLFLLAESPSVNQNAVHDENRRYSDVLQGNFVEAYRNLTYKHIMGLQWVMHYCPQAEFVVKMDDDIIVNVYKLASILSYIPDSQKQDLLMGYLLKGMIPVREPANKWYVTHAEFSGSVYPEFLSGWMYVTTPQVIHRLLDAALLEKFFWIDDTFVTGVLAQRAGIKNFKNISDMFTTDPGFLECCLRHPNVNCDFVVGPSGGDYSLQARLAQHALACEERGCQNRSPENSLRKTCVIEGRQKLLFLDGHGYASEIKEG